MGGEQHQPRKVSRARARAAKREHDRRAQGNGDVEQDEIEALREHIERGEFDVPPRLEITRDDFWSVLSQGGYIYVPTRDLWPTKSVEARVHLKDANGEPIRASHWLDQHRAVVQMTWAPGEPMIVEGRVVQAGGWIEKPGVKVFNLYQPPVIKRGDPRDVSPWLDLLHFLYPDEDEARHIKRWFAHRVQKPREKVNHAIVLGGKQGIGKDSILEPVLHAVGPWNFGEVNPMQLLGRFNSFLRSVVLRVSEAHDLGEVNRFALYEHCKVLTAAPPVTLRCDEKNLREHQIFNLCGVVVTTNHKAGGLYLPADDRRHFVVWSDREIGDYAADYWKRLYRWYERGGFANVTAYLQDLDLSGFDAKAPPLKTPAFWEIVDSNRTPEDAELADALDKLGMPDAVTITMVIDKTYETDAAFADFLQDRRNSRLIPHRFESAGYVAVRNPDETEGRWRVNGKRTVIYGRADLPLRDRITAARKIAGSR
jgi:hypothetical protein